MKDIKICNVCGAEYYSRKHGSKYCSKKCVYLGRPKRQKVRIDVSCKGCGKTFGAKKSEVRRGKSNFCSKTCLASFRKRIRTIICEKCGVTFERHNTHRRYCSRECFQSAVDNKEVHKYTTYLSNGGYPSKHEKPLHRTVAEAVLGRLLKKGEVVHHINGDKMNFKNSNLIICSQSYHRIIHERMGRKYMELFLQ